MPFTNVVLLNCSDSAYIAGAITKDDGSFPIATDKQDRLLKVASIGYTKRFNATHSRFKPKSETICTQNNKYT